MKYNSILDGIGNTPHVKTNRLFADYAGKRYLSVQGLFEE